MANCWDVNYPAVEWCWGVTWRGNKLKVIKTKVLVDEWVYFTATFSSDSYRSRLLLFALSLIFFSNIQVCYHLFVNHSFPHSIFLFFSFSCSVIHIHLVDRFSFRYCVADALSLYSGSWIGSWLCQQYLGSWVSRCIVRSKYIGDLVSVLLN